MTKAIHTARQAARTDFIAAYVLASALLDPKFRDKFPMLPITTRITECDHLIMMTLLRAMLTSSSTP
jgi:hypothetical protein